MTMKCSTFRSLTEAGRDRDLGQGEASELDAHAGRCAACADLHRREAALRALLCDWRDAERQAVVLPAGFAQRVARRAAERQAKRSRRLLPLVGLAATAAAAAIVLVVTWGPPQGTAERPVVAHDLPQAGASREPAASPWHLHETEPWSLAPAASRTMGEAPLLYSDGTIDVVGPARPTRDATPAVQTAVLVEYRF